MKILAFGASNSKNSINKQLVTHAAEVLKSEIDPDAEVEIIDLNDFEMPIYSIDRENEDGIPERAQEFYDKIGSADGLLISYAVHNGTYTVAFKNIFDWASRIDSKVFQNKPMVIMAASPGPGGGASVLTLAEASAPFFGADIRDSFSVGPFSEKFDRQTGTLTDAETSQKLRDALKTLR